MFLLRRKGERIYLIDLSQLKSGRIDTDCVIECFKTITSIMRSLENIQFSSKTDYTNSLENASFDLISIRTLNEFN